MKPVKIGNTQPIAPGFMSQTDLETVDGLAKRLMNHTNNWDYG